MRNITGTKVGALGFAGALLIGCSGRAPVNEGDPGLILHGDMPWGSAAIYESEDGCVTGDLPWGDVDLCREGDEITGKSPWGKVEVTVGDGRITGKLPWGNIDLRVEGTSIEGDLPWGGVDVQVEDGRIQGDFPWGDADLEFGPVHDNLEDPLVITALIAVLSDKT